MRTILHFDLDAFFCAVEQRRNPALANTAFVVAGHSKERGVVATASYAARAFGIRAGTPTARALQLCRELVVVRPDFRAYMQASRDVIELVRSEYSAVEHASIDEAYVDITLAPDAPAHIARHLQQRIASELQLSVSCGVASNKLVAKAATDIAKQRARQGIMPHAILVVPTGGEAAFLAPLPVDTLCGVGPKTTARLHALGIMTLGEIAWTRSSDIRAHFSRRQAEELIRWSKGIDHAPLVFHQVAKSLSHSTTFLRDTNERELIAGTLVTLTYELARRLQHKQLRARVVSCYLRWDIHSGDGRQARLVRASSDGRELSERVLQLLDMLWDGVCTVRHVGVAVSGLGDYPAQLGLWDEPACDTSEQAAEDAISDAEEFMGHAASTHRLSHTPTKRWSAHDA